MASLTWRGDAQSQAQANTITVGGTYADGQVYTVTINRKEVVYTSITGDDNTAVAAALAALLTASTLAEYRQVTWTVSGLVITATASSPGVPFTNTSAATGTGTLVTATTVASAGPEDYSAIDNWSGGALPVNGDDVTIAVAAGNIRYGLPQTAVTLVGFVVAPTWSGDIGLPDYNPLGYVEYRPRYLAIKVNGTATVDCASSLMRIDFSSQAVNVQVEGTGNQGNAAMPALSILGTSITSLNVLSGSYGVAVGPGEVSTVTTVRQGSGGDFATPPTGTLGAGCTLTAITLAAGQLELDAAATTVNVYDGALTFKGAAAMTTLNAQGGSVYYQSTGTLTTATVGTGATLDFSRDIRARTVTSTTLAARSTLIDPSKSVTFTNAILLSNCSLAEVTIDWGQGFSIQRS